MLSAVVVAHAAAMLFSPTTGAGSHSVMGQHRVAADIRMAGPAGGGGGGGGLFADLANKAKAGLQQQASQALDDLQRELSQAAMQEPGTGMDPAARVEAPMAPATELPDSFDDAIGQAVVGCSEAVLDGVTNLVIEFDTSAGDETYNLLSRSLKFAQPFLTPFADAIAPAAPADPDGASADVDADLPPRVQMLFPDEGTAAYVRNNWQDLPPRTLCASMPRAQLAQGAEVLMLVAPQATEVSAVQRLLSQVAEQAPNTVVLLVNPKLVDMQSTGYGLVGRDLRNMVQDAFTVVCALKTYPSGALFRVYPGGWSVWREDAAVSDGSGYTLAYSSTRRPDGDQVDELLAPPDDDSGEGGGGSPLDGLASFIKGFQAM